MANMAVSIPSAEETKYYDGYDDPGAMKINEEIEAHIRKEYNNENELFWMQQEFRRDGYLKIRNVVPDKLKKRVADEARSLLDRMAKRRDIHLEVTDNSPRFMSNVRQQDIARHGSVIPAVYHSRALMDFFGAHRAR